MIKEDDIDPIINNGRKTARPFPTRHLHKTFDKDSDTPYFMIILFIIILLVIWTILEDM